MNVAIVADDLTGANDVGAEFGRVGLDVDTILDIDELKSITDDEDEKIISIDTETRDLTAQKAKEKVRRVTNELAKLSYSRIFQKIDSAFRGNVAVEIEVLLKTLKLNSAFIVPAIPTLGRITVGGYQLLNGQPIEKLKAATESHIPTLLKKTSRLKIGHLSLSHVIKGQRAIQVELRRLIKEKNRLILIDAADCDDLDAIGRVLVKHWPGNLVVGSVGIACGLAGSLGVKKQQKRKRVKRKGNVLVVVGTPHQVTRLQVKKLIKSKAATVYNGKAKNANILLHDPVKSASRDKQISTRLSKQVRKIIAEGDIGSLVLTGGDTAYKVLKELGARGIRIEAILSDAIIAGTVIGGNCEGLAVVTKGGSIGDDDALIMAANYLRSKLK